MNHPLRMLLGCLLPLAFIFVLPLFGVGSGVTLLVFVGLMFMCHLMMMGGRGHGHDQNQDKGANDEQPGIHQHDQY